MDKITQYLNKISYKFPKGYPDVNDPKDMEILMEMVNEFTLQENSGGSATYDDTIRFTLFGKDKFKCLGKKAIGLMLLRINSFII